MAQQERAVQTRSKVLEAAAQVFAEHGYASASMAQILATAGVTKGAVYFHFSSKEDLAKAVVAEQANWLAGGESAEGSGLQGLIDLSHRFAHGLRTDPIARGAVRLVIEYGSFSSPDPTPYLQWIAGVRALLLVAREEDALRDGVDVDAAAEALVGMFTGIQLIAEVLSGRQDLDRRITSMWELVLPNLARPEALPELRLEGSPAAA
ncbi:ScbR family autoregulator-binding transcription factor [Kitasatospora sp. GAS204B]|uniref:ScbR family autoregulator-binding transcription factor n=1 Tax=unclassified Kitasatospora TaxID=2633591 RepID=UPI0024743792|nr:ScbR family autoregulator-binding transcription factor [Kitasatospora sp. GAS204B]MDH6117272.1 AcrR family transcriptional regulator [Kitasatospora sp. GAS204B]